MTGTLTSAHQSVISNGVSVGGAPNAQWAVVNVFIPAGAYVWILPFSAAVLTAGITTYSYVMFDAIQDLEKSAVVGSLTMTK